MKLIIDKCIYIQKKDLIYLCYYNSDIPYSILLKINNILINNKNNINEFIKFDEEKELEYFKKIDWILDFNEIKDLNNIEIENFKENILSESETLLKKIKQMTFKEQTQDMNLNIKWILYNYKYNSLNEINIAKEEKLKIEHQDKKILKIR